jgi:flagellar biosynthetic protein FliQ
MNPQDAIDFSREALKTCMMVGGPILAASLLIGLLIGVFQAMTQVQDQTVSFVPKILLLIVLIGLCLPWLTDQMLDFAKHSFETPMTQWAGSSHQSLFPKPNDNPDSRQTQSASFSRPPTRTDNLPRDSVTTKVIDQTAPSHLSIPQFQMPNSNEIVPKPPPKSSFILPHYRITKAPKSEIGG